MFLQSEFHFLKEPISTKKGMSPSHFTDLLGHPFLYTCLYVVQTAIDGIRR